MGCLYWSWCHILGWPGLPGLWPRLTWARGHWRLVTGHWVSLACCAAHGAPGDTHGRAHTDHCYEADWGSDQRQRPGLTLGQGGTACHSPGPASPAGRGRASLSRAQAASSSLSTAENQQCENTSVYANFYVAQFHFSVANDYLTSSVYNLTRDV